MNFAARAPLRTLQAIVIALLVAANSASAADSPSANAPQARYALNVPAQDLESALQAVALAMNGKMLYERDVVKGKVSANLQGDFTAEEAVQQLLSGTDLTYEFTSSSVVLIRQKGRPSAARSSSLHEISSQSGNPLRLARMGDEKNAANSTEATNDSAAKPAIQEILVTAQKREERLQDVPMSITALSSSAIASRGLVGLDDYLRSVPAVSYVDQGPGQNTIVIRGAYGDPFSTGPTVGLYLGDIPLTGLALGSTADIKLVDIDRVEVLRGPQGTLYGANSLSGTIRHIPAAPKLNKFETRLDVGYSSTAKEGGSNGDVQGMINIPLLDDRLALRAVAYHFENSGFIKNIAGDDPSLLASAAFFGASGQAGNQDHVGGSTADGVRASFLWAPLDNLHVALTYMRQDDSADDRPFSQRGLGEYERSVYRFGPIVGDGDALKIALEIENLTVDYQMPWGTFLSSTSVIDQDYRRLWQIGSFFRVSGFTPPVPQDSITNAHLFTEEARFTSSFEGPLQFVAGVFYEKSRQPTTQIAYYTGDPARNPFAPLYGLIYSGYLDRRLEQIAGFGEVSYALTRKLKVTGGIRHFKYDSTFVSNSLQSTNTAIVPMSFFTGSGTESGDTYKLGVEFKALENTLLYAKYSEGFRLGRPKNISQVQNFCDLDRDGLIDGTQLSARDPLVGSDNLDSYEAGVKASLLGGRAAVSASGYHNTWKNIPVTFRPPTCSLVSTSYNVGEVQADGFEVEGTVDLLRKVRMDFGVGYIDSRLAATSPLGAKGATMNFTPKWNGHVGAEYRFEVAGHDTYLRGDYSYYDKFFTGLGGTGARFDAYGLLDVSVGINLDKIDVRAFAENVTGKYAIGSDSGWPANGIYPIRPRTIGLRLGYSF